MAKYKEVYELMVKENTELFDEFEWVHENYLKNPDKWQRTFNMVGEKVLEVVRKYEDILCRKSEGAGFGKFSSNLAEKFQQELRKHFPKFNHIGIQPN